MNDLVNVVCYNINGESYILLKELDLNGKHYVYLTNQETNKTMVRVLENDLLKPLDSVAELNLVFKKIIEN